MSWPAFNDRTTLIVVEKINKNNDDDSERMLKCTFWLMDSDMEAGSD